MRINILDAKNRLSELIRAACAGEEVIIANRGRPVARLVAIGSTEQDAPRGSAQALLNWVDEHPAPKSVRRSAAEIDTAIEEEREAWR